MDQYPLPSTEDLFATLAGLQVFSKIDLSHAYKQVELDEVLTTHKGLYRYKRLPFGVSSAPAGGGDHYADSYMKCEHSLSR